MKKLQFLSILILSSVLSFAQYDICYGPPVPYTAEYPSVVFNANTGCYEECTSGLGCPPPYTQTFLIKEPIICSDINYSSTINDDVRVSFMYNNLPCGPAWLPALRHWQELWDVYRDNLFYLRCDGVWDGIPFTDVWQPPFYDPIDYPINNQVTQAGGPKRMVAYELKDACTAPPSGDNGGSSSKNSGCMCFDDLVLEVNGITYPTPFLGSTSTPTSGGTTYITTIPTSSGKQLTIYQNGNVMIFGEI